MIKEDKSTHVDKLITSAQNGNARAFGQVYDLFVDQIYRYTLIKIGNAIDAQDITAETFKRAWINLNRYKKNNFRAYLYTIARNIIIDHIRKRAKLIKLSNNESVVDKKADVEHRVLKKQEIQRLYEAIKKLPKAYAEVIMLRFIEELSIRETAKTLGKSSISIRVTQHRALKKLKNLLT